MGFETPEQRANREKSEAAFREANVRRYEEAMKVELPYSPVAVVERKPELKFVKVDPPKKFDLKDGQYIERKPVEVPGVILGSELPAKPKLKGKRQRGAYMAAFRKRPVVCPACGHTFKELKRVKE